MRCVIIDGMPIYLMGFSSLLESFFPSWKISTAGSLKEGTRKIYESPRDRLGIVILDQDLCAECDGGFVPRIRAMPNPHPVGIVLLGNATQKNKSLFDLWGVDAFVDRQSSPDEIVQIIGSAVACKAPNQAHPKVCRRYARRSATVNEMYSSYSGRDLSNKQIANKLQLTYGTVKNYMVTLMRQFNVCSRLELVAKLNDVNLQREPRVPALSEQQRNHARRHQRNTTVSG